MKRFQILRRLGWVALAGLALVICGLLPFGIVARLLLILGALAILSLFTYIVVITILHWKDRYRGKRSDLWGALMVIGSSGWFRLVYFFRHVLPDMNGQGRYRRPLVPMDAERIAEMADDGQDVSRFFAGPTRTLYQRENDDIPVHLTLPQVQELDLLAMELKMSRQDAFAALLRRWREPR